MLPDFDENGNLPPGIHPCDTNELIARFGSGSPEREVEMKELLDFIQWAQAADVQRLVVNGSFVTDKIEPNDVDIVILPGPGYPRNELSYLDQELRWPFLQVFTAADEHDLETWVSQDFGTDRNQYPKGVVEVLL